MAWMPAYASTSELASLVRIGDTADDAQLALAIETASRSIDHATGRQFGQVAAAEARYYQARWDCRTFRWTVEIDDLATRTGLAVDVDILDRGTYPYSVDVTYVGLRPSNAVVKGFPWTHLTILPTGPVQFSDVRDAIRVTARWGWATVPTAIKHATLLQASRLLAARDAPFGVAGSPDAGAQIRLLARLDPNVVTAIAPYRRWWGAV